MGPSALPRSSRIPRWGVLGLAVALPLAFNPVAASLTLVKEVLGTTAAPLLAGLWLWAASGDRRFRLPRSPLLLPLGIMAAAALAAALLSPYPVAALRELFRIEAGLLLILLARVGLIGVGESYFRIAAGTAVLVSAYAVTQGFGRDLWRWSRPLRTGSFATFGHPNFLADYLLVLLLPTALWAWSARRSPWPMAAAGLIALALGLTRSTGAALGLGAAAWLAALWLAPRRGRLLLAVGGLAAGIVGPLLIWSTGPGRAFLRANLFRIETWRGAARILGGQPILGAGLGTFPILFPSHRVVDFIPRFRYAENLLHAHCEYLELGAEQGAIGLLAFFLLVATAALVAVRRVPRLSGPRRLLAVGAFAGLGAGLVHNLVCVNLRWAGPWFSFCLTLGAALALVETEPLQRRNGSDPAWLTPLLRSLAVLLLLWSAAAGWLGWKRLGSDDAYHRAQLVLFQPDKGPAVAALKDALELDSHNLPVRYDLAYALTEAGRFGEAVEQFRRIARESPDYQRLHRNEAIALMSAGRYREAQSALEEGLRVNREEANLFMRALVAEKLDEPDALERSLEFLERSLGFLRSVHDLERRAPRGFQQVRPHEYPRIKTWTKEGLELAERLLTGSSPEETHRAWQRLRRNASGDGTLPALLGARHLELGNPERARDLFQEALSQEPENVDAWNGLGECRLLAGDAPGARDAWERSLAIRSDQELIKNRLREVVR